MIKKLVFFASIILFLAGCKAYFNQPMKTVEPRLGVETETENQLEQLPPPQDKIVAAVYNFRDKTGQYKQTETGGSWSTVVTQGATSILLKALDDTKWFTIIEREGLGNLLNERKIIRSSRQQYNKGKGSQLPPLLYAGILLEGGIISYDYNMITGGAGLRYFGAGGSGQYRQDRVTVYLRAVSTQNGKILKTVYTTKKILSQKVSGDMFRYVKFKRILEAETGFSYNEPSEIAVREAIEKAVQSLVVEGLFDGLWELQNPKDINNELIQSYVGEKAMNKRTDIFGIEHQEEQKKFSVYTKMGASRYDGDYRNEAIDELYNVGATFSLAPKWETFIDWGQTYLSTQEFLNVRTNYTSIGLKHIMFPTMRFSPYFTANYGLISPLKRKDFYVGFSTKYYHKAGANVGAHYLLGEERSIGLSADFNFNYIFSDEIDGVTQGKYNDYFWGVRFGLAYYFNLPFF